MTTSTTSIDIMGLQAAYANLHTDQERDYFMQLYHDVISSFGGNTSYDADVLFFFNDTATTEIYTLSLHDALPISPSTRDAEPARRRGRLRAAVGRRDRKSTRLNSSHVEISYAAFCLKKKKKPRQLADGPRAHMEVIACIKRPPLP